MSFFTGTLLLLSAAAIGGGEQPPPPPAGPGAEVPPPPVGGGDQLLTPPPPPGGTQVGVKSAGPVGPQAKQPGGFLAAARQLAVTGFWEIRGGVRTQSDRHEKDASLGETRLHLDWQKSWKGVTFKFVPDFIYDPVLDRHSKVNLEAGRGWLDLRQANASFSPTEFMDVKVGRQILTWGTGDLLFINDMFSKDWQAFFIGRDEQYLKAPSDALKISLFSDLANMEAVYTPRFDPDRFVRGRRLSYYNSTLGRRAGRDAVVNADVPDKWFNDSEWAVRVFKNIKSYELAGYGYWGYWKSPGGMDAASGKATFPRLGVYGASLRGPVAKGIGNVEVGYYDSHQDRSGQDPMIRNSEFRFLLGYDRDLPEIAHDFTVGVQYYVEWMADYDNYRASLPAGAPKADERHQIVTFRITKMLMNQNLTLSLFTYYSPSDSDVYLRPRVSYQINDHWSTQVGGNIFAGKYDHTFFGQFARDTNLYASLRCSF